MTFYLGLCSGTLRLKLTHLDKVHVSVVSGVQARKHGENLQFSETFSEHFNPPLNIKMIRCDVPHECKKGTELNGIQQKERGFCDVMKSDP